MAITPNYDLDVDTSLGGNSASDYVIPSQKAIKSYVDNNTGGNVKLDGGSSSQTIQLSSGTGTTPITLKSKSTGSCYVSYYANTTWVGSLGVNSSKRPSFYNGSSYTLAYTSELPTTFTGCDSITAGISGLVPAPNAGDENKFLKADGTWSSVSGGGGTATDVQINGTSITSNDVANIITNSAYNASNNKIATMSDVPTTASDINAADTDLSNLSATGKTVIDGQWVFNDQSIIANQSLNGSTDLLKTVTLPNDGHLYEVMLMCNIVTGGSSGNQISLYLTSSLGGTRVLACEAITRTSSTMRAGGTLILPMQYGSNNLTIRRDSTYNGTATINVRAYRRIGSNA